MPGERERMLELTLTRQREFMRFMRRNMPTDWLSAEITMSQFKTLVVLYELGHATMGELADALGIGVSTVTGLVDRLVDHHLVVREEDPSDRRVVVGRLTPEGNALVDRLCMGASDRFKTVIDELSLDELCLVEKAIELLCDAATRAFSGQPVPAGAER